MAIVSSAALVLFSLSTSLPHPAAVRPAAAPGTSAAAVAETRPKPPDVDLRRLGDGLVYAFTKGLFARGNVAPLLIGAAGALLVHPADASLTRHLGGSAPGLGTTGNVLGGPWVAAGALGGFLLVAPLTHDTKVRGTAFSLFEAYAVDTALVQGLKAATRRTRPNGSNTQSFPSGHTSDAFLLATVLSHDYGPRMAVPTYALAALVAVARVESRDHWASDTVAGATVGCLAAMAAVRSAGHAGRRRTTVMPVLGPGRAGAFVTIGF